MRNQNILKFIDTNTRTVLSQTHIDSICVSIQVNDNKVLSELAMRVVKVF